MYRTYLHAMTKYAQTIDVKLTLPIAIYTDIKDIMKADPRWAYPQNFIIEAINEKIEEWKEVHQTSGVVHRKE